MKINFKKNVRNIGVALVLTGTITACAVVIPRILGSYFNEDVKKNKYNVMSMLTKTKKNKKKILVKNERSTMKI